MSLPPYVRSIVKYKSPHPQDLSFAKGEIVRVLGLAERLNGEEEEEDEEDHWYIGELLDRSKQGQFPASLVQPIDPKEVEEAVPTSHESNSPSSEPSKAAGAAAATAPHTKDSAPMDPQAPLRAPASHTEAMHQEASTDPDAVPEAAPHIEQTPAQASTENAAQEATAAPPSDVPLSPATPNAPIPEPEAPVPKPEPVAESPVRPESGVSDPSRLSLRDRIAAFNKPLDRGPPPIPRGKPGGWKRPPAPENAPKPPMPATSHSAATSTPRSAEPVGEPVRNDAPGSFSASDAKNSIKMSLKERMAALQRGEAESKPWAPSPTPLRKLSRDDAVEPCSEEPSNEDEVSRRAAIAERMARMGGQRMGPFGGMAVAHEAPKPTEAPDQTERVQDQDEKPPGPSPSESAAPETLVVPRRAAAPRTRRAKPVPGAPASAAPQVSQTEETPSVTAQPAEALQNAQPQAMKEPQTQAKELMVSNDMESATAHPASGPQTDVQCVMPQEAPMASPPDPLATPSDAAPQAEPLLSGVSSITAPATAPVSEPLETEQIGKESTLAASAYAPPATATLPDGAHDADAETLAAPQGVPSSAVPEHHPMAPSTMARRDSPTELPYATEALASKPDTPDVSDSRKDAVPPSHTSDVLSIPAQSGAASTEVPPSHMALETAASEEQSVQKLGGLSLATQDPVQAPSARSTTVELPVLKEHLASPTEPPQTERVSSLPPASAQEPAGSQQGGSHHYEPDAIPVARRVPPPRGAPPPVPKPVNMPVEKPTQANSSTGSSEADDFAPQRLQLEQLLAQNPESVLPYANPATLELENKSETPVVSHDTKIASTSEHNKHTYVPREEENEDEPEVPPLNLGQMDALGLPQGANLQRQDSVTSSHAAPVFMPSPTDVSAPVFHSPPSHPNDVPPQIEEDAEQERRASLAMRMARMGGQRIAGMPGMPAPNQQPVKPPTSGTETIPPPETPSAQPEAPVVPQEPTMPEVPAVPTPDSAPAPQPKHPARQAPVFPSGHTGLESSLEGDVLPARPARGPPSRPPPSRAPPPPGIPPAVPDYE